MTIPSTILLLAAILVSGPAHAVDTRGTLPSIPTPLAKATFAGGCFWCMEPPYDKLDGVISTTSGYIGGDKPNPTYEEVSAGGTGHAEAIEVLYNPTKISYTTLLNVFWRNIDPTTRDRQFCDVGHQYRTAIFYHDEEQKHLAGDSRAKRERPSPSPSRSSPGSPPRACSPRQGHQASSTTRLRPAALAR